jgi:hypothetical protein
VNRDKKVLPPSCHGSRFTALRFTVYDESYE